MRVLGAVKDFASKHRRALLVTAALVVVAFAAVIVSYVKIGSYDKYIVGEDSVATAFGGEPSVGIVFGGGIEDGRPRPHLQDRLDAAARLYQEGKVRKLLVSGDNRFLEYNEPQTMRNYLVGQKGVPEDDVQLDNAGRSTYETCERAKKVFGLDKALLVTQGTHLPRAIYLCRSFGIEAYGFDSTGQASVGWQIGQRWREVMARAKAVINVYVWGEKTVLGDPITL